MDRIRNEIIRGTTKVGEISKKVQESRLKWYGHVSRREDDYLGKRVMGMEVPGKRRRGRPKRRWLDSIRNDLSERGLSEEDAQDRPRWRRLTRHIDPKKKMKMSLRLCCRVDEAVQRAESAVGCIEAVHTTP